MSEAIKKSELLAYLKNYRSYLKRVSADLDGADYSYAMFEGAVMAVDNMLVEIKEGKVRSE
jgi:hypothetical protein